MANCTLFLQVIFTFVVTFAFASKSNELKDARFEEDIHNLIIRQFEMALGSNNLDNIGKKDSEEWLALISKMECKMANVSIENSKYYFAAIKDQTAKVCGINDSDKMDKNNVQTLVNDVNVTFERHGNKMVDKMRRAEHTVKVHIGGEYGTLADILPKVTKTANLGIYSIALNSLRLISQKMESGPTKKVMAQLLNRHTTVSGQTGNGIMPSDLFKLAMALWHIVFRENGQKGTIDDEQSLNQPPLNKQQQDKTAGAQLLKQVTNDHFRPNAVVRRRRRSLRITTRQLANVFQALIAVVLVLNVMRLMLRTMADQLDQPPIFVLAAIAGTIRYYMTLE